MLDAFAHVYNNNKRLGACVQCNNNNIRLDTFSPQQLQQQLDALVHYCVSNKPRLENCNSNKRIDAYLASSGEFTTPQGLNASIDANTACYATHNIKYFRLVCLFTWVHSVQHFQTSRIVFHTSTSKSCTQITSGKPRLNNTNTHGLIDDYVQRLLWMVVLACLQISRNLFSMGSWRQFFYLSTSKAHLASCDLF
jgi:hypothetical protein